MNKLLKHFALSAFALSGMTVTPAGAQNPNYAPGGLVLGFQNPGGATGSSETVLINLGDTALDFRNATSDRINIVRGDSAASAA